MKKLHYVGVILFFLIVLGPIVALFPDVIVHGNEMVSLLMPTGRRLGLFTRSVVLAGSVATCGMFFGVLGSTLLWQWNKGVKKYLRWIVFSFIAVPPYVHALAWMAAMKQFNNFLEIIGFGVLPMQGWGAAWWVQLMSLLPIALGLAFVGLLTVDAKLIEGGRMLRSDTMTFFKVIIPLAAPVIVAGGGFLFLLSITDYSVPSLFQLNVYALELFADFSATNVPARAFILAIPLMFITGIVLFLAQSRFRTLALSSFTKGQVWRVQPKWERWFVYLQRCSLILIALQVLIPLFSLIILTGSFQAFIEAVVTAKDEILFTLLVSGLSAFLCLPLAYSVAKRLFATGSKKRWWLVVMLPLAVPAPLIGIGLIVLWNRPFPIEIYATGLMPVFVSLARFTPVAAILIFVQLRRVDTLLFDATKMLQTGKMKTWFQIYVPLLAPGFLTAALFVFALTMGELGATLIVAPAGKATLTMRIYNYLHYGSSEMVAGLCLLITIATLGIGFLGFLIMSHWNAMVFRIRKGGVND